MGSRFTSWALDKRRSREERYGAELLIDFALGSWRCLHKVPEDFDFKKIRRLKRQRSLNPAYQPAYSGADAERAAEVLPTLDLLSIDCSEDRPLRDLGFLQFCPTLRELTVHQTEIRDWTPLRWVPQLRLLDILDGKASDLKPVAQLAKLREFECNIDAPWPDLGPLEQLAELENLSFEGNLLVLQSIPQLLRLRDARFVSGARFNTPLRRVADLPEMPELRWLVLNDVCDLRGIERYSQLLSLSVSGYFEDLSSLASLRRLTHVDLGNGFYNELRPLAQLPELRQVAIRREEPVDCTPLSDAPRLHEVTVEGCPVQLAELAALRAVLPPWDDEFAVPPRPLKPLRFVVLGPHEIPEDDPAAREEDWGEDAGMRSSESDWFGGMVHRNLRTLLGESWPSEEGNGSFIRVSAAEHIDRFPEIVECIRKTMATTKYPHMCAILVNPGEEFEGAIRGARHEDEFDADKKRQEWEHLRHRRREEQEYLERAYRCRLRQEQGLPVRPEDFSPPQLESEFEASGSGDALEADGEDLSLPSGLFVLVSESTVYVYERDRDKAQLLLGIKPE
jgi:hypothetical protein